MKKLICLSVCALLVATAALTLPASAQPRDAGFKMRGDYGRPSARSARTQTSVPRTVVRGPFVQPQMAEETDESYRSFAFEPLNVGQGDKVVVSTNTARLMRGQRVVGTANQGEQLTVLRIQGPWIGTSIDTEQGSVGGWVWYKDVAPANSNR